MAQIQIKISSIGKIDSIETEGFQGDSCKNITASLENALTSSVNSSETEFKGEFYEDVEGGVHEKEHERW